MRVIKKKQMEKMYESLEDAERIELGKALAEEFYKNGFVPYGNGYNGVIIDNSQAIDAIQEWCISEEIVIFDWMRRAGWVFYIEHELCLFKRKNLIEEIEILLDLESNIVINSL